MAVSNQKPSRPKNSNFTEQDSNVKLRGFQKIKKSNQKIKFRPFQLWLSTLGVYPFLK